MNFYLKKQNAISLENSDVEERPREVDVGRLGGTGDIEERPENVVVRRLLCFSERMEG